MKKILVFAVFVLSSMVLTQSCFAQVGWRNSITIHLYELNHVSTLKLFNKATKECQFNNITNLLREAEDRYYECESLEDLYDLDTKMDVIKQFLDEAKISHSQGEADFKVLQRKIRRSIAAAEEDSDYDMTNSRRGNRGQDKGVYND